MEGFKEDQLIICCVAQKHALTMQNEDKQQGQPVAYWQLKMEKYKSRMTSGRVNINSERQNLVVYMVVTEQLSHRNTWAHISACRCVCVSIWNCIFSCNSKATHPFSAAILGLFIFTTSAFHFVCKRKKIKTSLAKTEKHKHSIQFLKWA